MGASIGDNQVEPRAYLCHKVGHRTPHLYYVWRSLLGSRACYATNSWKKLQIFINGRSGQERTEPMKGSITKVCIRFPECRDRLVVGSRDGMHNKQGRILRAALNQSALRISGRYICSRGGVEAKEQAGPRKKAKRTSSMVC